MVPQLTSGAIDRIFQWEDVPNAILQILGCKKINGPGNDRYRLLISDGVIGCPFAMLGTQLNHMVTNRELLKFTVIRVDKYVCNQVQDDRKVIILLNLTVLCPGDDVNEKIGNPVNSINANSTRPAPSAVAAVMNGLSLNVKMVPQITSGAIDRILQGEDVPNAILQILCYKKINGTGNDRYRLLISDGVIEFPFAMLGTQLSHMVTNRELERFTVVRVDRYVCNQVQADRKIIILLNLTVLCPGHDVNDKIGNPVNSINANSAQSAPSAVADVINGHLCLFHKRKLHKQLALQAQLP